MKHRRAFRGAFRRGRSRPGRRARSKGPAGMPPTARPGGARGAVHRFQSCAAPTPSSARARPARHASSPEPCGAGAAMNRMTRSYPLQSTTTSGRAPGDLTGTSPPDSVSLLGRKAPPRSGRCFLQCASTGGHQRLFRAAGGVRPKPRSLGIRNSVLDLRSEHDAGTDCD